MLIRLDLRAAFLTALLCLPLSAVKADPVAPLCEALAARAGAEAGLPEGLLPAIARVESGKRTAQGVRAWPWTLNQGGDGSYHASLAEALAHLDGLLAKGIRNVDLGCMQLNWRWHGDAFPDAATMMDPVANTRYAAAFLRDLHRQHGSWTQAVAHYHSADPARGPAYAARVARVRDEIGAPALPQDGGAACQDGAGPGAAAMPGTVCAPRLRGLLVVAQSGLLTGGTGRDLRQAPDRATATPLGARYLR